MLFHRLSKKASGNEEHPEANLILNPRTLMDGSWTGSIGRLPRDVLFFLNNIEKLILERTSSPPHFSFSTATLEPCKPAPCLPLSQGCGKGSLSTSTGLNSPESPSTSAETSTAGPLLGAPGLTTRSKDATNGAPGLTRSKDAARSKGHRY